MRPLLVSFFVFFLMLLGTNYVYQNWLENDSNLEYSDNVAYSHASKVITLQAPSGKRLVPMGAVLGMNDVNTVEYSFKINIDAGESLSVYAKNVLFVQNNQSYTNYEELVDFNYEIEMINATEALVKVFVNLNMPSNEEEYLVMKGSTVSFEVVFLPQ